MKEGIIFNINQIDTVIMTNEGEFLSVPTQSNWQVGEKVSVTDFELKSNHKTRERPKQSKSFWQKKGIMIALVASLLLFMVPLANITEASTIVTLDINPSLELEVKNDKVIKTRALNDDGKYLISKIKSSDLNGDLYIVTSNIITQAEQLGYLKIGEENLIMIGLTKNTDFNESTYEEYILSELTEKNIEAEILVISGSKDEKKIADNNGLSLGKYLLQTKQKKDGSTVDEQVTKEDIKEFAKTVKQEDENNKDKNNSSNQTNGNKTKENTPDAYVISNSEKIKQDKNDKSNKDKDVNREENNSNKENKDANKKAINQKQQSGEGSIKDEGVNKNLNNSSKQGSSSNQGNSQTNSTNNKK